MKTALLFFSMAAMLQGEPKVIALPSKSPIVTFRIVFRTGAASDPKGKEGVASLTASMLASGGTKAMSYQQILDAFYPMAVQVGDSTDKEMIAFTAATHVDNLDAFYRIFKTMLLDPGWRPEDFARTRDDQVNFLATNLRGNNDEELGKEALYNEIYLNRPYGHHNEGAIGALKSLKLDDLQSFYAKNFTQANLIVGIAGGYPPGFPNRVKKDFEKLPKGKLSKEKLPPPMSITATEVKMIEKNTRSVAISLGYPIDVRRGDPDFPALLLAQSYLGQHRSSGGLLYARMREARGLNYGDYAYIEYFPQGMFRLEPQPNLARQQQIFQIWIRPVEPKNAHFALRLALFELNKLIAEGIPEEEFERTKSFIGKYSSLLMKTKSAELGYAIDSFAYGIPRYDDYVRDSIAKLTRDEVTAVVRKHLRTNRLRVVIVGQDTQALRDQLIGETPSPMTYNSPKPKELLDEDQVVSKWRIGVGADQVVIAPVEKVFE
jgi:zinc protease